MAPPHAGHEKHLCKLVATQGIDSVRRFSQNPHWICLTCGRVAENKENICEPDPL
jgi:hypothetical protein